MLKCIILEDNLTVFTASLTEQQYPDSQLQNMHLLTEQTSLTVYRFPASSYLCHELLVSDFVVLAPLCSSRQLQSFQVTVPESHKSLHVTNNPLGCATAAVGCVSFHAVRLLLNRSLPQVIYSAHETVNRAKKQSDTVKNLKLLCLV